MKKNPNKKAGNWGALYNKPQNQVYFKDGGKIKVTAGGEKHVIYKKTTKRGEGKVGNIMVNHPTKDKGVWDTIDLTKKAGAKTIQQGVAATKKWHKENPYNNMKKQLTKKQMGGPSQKTKTVNKNGSYRTVEKTKSTPSSFKQSSKTTRTAYGIMKGAPKYKNILPAPVTPTEPSSDSKYMKKGGSIRKYQAGGTADSTKYFHDKFMKESLIANKILKKEGAYSKNYREADKVATKSSADYLRQIRKGKPGYDKNGRPIKAMDMLQKMYSTKKGKYQTGGATKDSTDYFKADKNLYYKQAETNAKYGLGKEADEMMKKAIKAELNELRQKNKGKLGYDANGHPVDIKKQLEQEELLRRAKKMGHNTIEEYKNSNWGYGKNYKKATTPKKKK